MEFRKPVRPGAITMSTCMPCDVAGNASVLENASWGGQGEQWAKPAILQQQIAEAIVREAAQRRPPEPARRLMERQNGQTQPIAKVGATSRWHRTSQMPSMTDPPTHQGQLWAASKELELGGQAGS